ncbi:hypothetical protein G7Y89_g10674 [Cudoniella acicularis]|uniref:RING-type domain-containing protein n=1 Tax=Cudoniella acicularis TaxID=354080 RepID=A0A8H4RDU7_9HELO|nr:hypothetical protein G7Y89_g10674 [Cudoniella acicularis]
MLLGSRAAAQSVQPSNSTLPSSESAAMTQLKLSGGPVLQTPFEYNIAPLTTQVGKGQTSTAVQSISITGTVRLADPSTPMNFTNTDIAFISCDPNDSNIDASSTVSNAGALKPKAIILYSEIANECNLTGSFSYSTIYTMISAADTQSLLETIDLYPSTTDILSAQIGTNTTSSTSSSSSTSNDGGPAPTTAVAMSILYSITGIITLLFLIIIATGAVRAHRHPERYGPRNGYSGRPRQSRAKGLARAMLETLPIVKFGDPEPGKPGSRDVELENGNGSVHNVPAEVTSQEVTVPDQRSKNSPLSPIAEDADAGEAVLESGMGAAQAESVKSLPEGAAVTAREGELGCSICTEDFIAGEDVRVLPCQHKYHPACIDPWLLNVSGTCPLCRHDLRPDTSGTSNTVDSDDLPPPLEGDHEAEAEAEDGTAPHGRRRMSRFLDLNRLRHAPPDERIAALRELREQSRTDAEPMEDPEEQISRRARLTSRLRDTFRIRTRTQNVNPQ